MSLHLPDPARPAFVPILLPTDLEVLRRLDDDRGFGVAAVSASYTTNPRLGPLVEAARDLSRTLLVDPVTAHFQFEGYMSMPDYRALPYSPGRGPLGTLWEPGSFDDLQVRRRLVDQVFGVQSEAGADLLLAPYVLIHAGDDPWREVALSLGAEAVDRATEPVGIPLMVHLDAILPEEDRRDLARDVLALSPSLVWLTVVDYDERRATPEEVGAVLDLIGRLAEEAPVIPTHTGRTGLLAAARGAAGYAAGLQGLETLSRRSMREGLATRPANRYYVQDLMVYLPVRLADAVIETRAGWKRNPCGCPACTGASGAGLMVSRLLTHHTVLQRRGEMEELRSRRGSSRVEHMRRRLTAALERCRRARKALEDRSTEAESGDRSAGADRASRDRAEPSEARLDRDHYHYLEVLREHAGGQEATIPKGVGPTI